MIFMELAMISMDFHGFSSMSIDFHNFHGFTGAAASSPHSVAVEMFDFYGFSVHIGDAAVS